MTLWNVPQETPRSRSPPRADGPRGELTWTRLAALALGRAGLLLAPKSTQAGTGRISATGPGYLAGRFKFPKEPQKAQPGEPRCVGRPWMVSAYSDQ